MCETQDALEAVTTAFLRSRLQSLPRHRTAAHSPRAQPLLPSQRGGPGEGSRALPAAR